MTALAGVILVIACTIWTSGIGLKNGWEAAAAFIYLALGVILIWTEICRLWHITDILADRGIRRKLQPPPQETTETIEMTGTIETTTIETTHDQA